MIKPKFVGVCSAVLALSLVVGCSSKDSKPKVSDDKTVQTTPAQGGDATASDSIVPKKKVVTDVRDPQGSVDGYEGALEDGSIDKCEVEGDKLRVEGKVTNPLDKPKQYRIYVSVMEGTDTRGIVQVDPPVVKAHETVSWNTDVDLAEDGLNCILRVERFDPQK